MSESEDRAAHLVRALQMSITGDVDAITQIYTPDVLAWSPAMTLSGIDELVAELNDRAGAFSDVRFEVEADVVDDRGYAEWVVTALHTGPLVVDDEVVVEPTGRPITLHGVTTARFSGNRISAFRQYWDELELLEGLGLLDEQ